MFEHVPYGISEQGQEKGQKEHRRSASQLAFANFLSRAGSFQPLEVILSSRSKPFVVHVVLLSKFVSKEGDSIPSPYQLLMESWFHNRDTNSSLYDCLHRNKQTRQEGRKPFAVRTVSSEQKLGRNVGDPLPSLCRLPSATPAILEYLLPRGRRNLGGRGAIDSGFDRNRRKHASQNSFTHSINDGEKGFRYFYFEIERVPSQLLLSSAKQSAQKG